MEGLVVCSVWGSHFFDVVDSDYVVSRWVGDAWLRWDIPSAEDDYVHMLFQSSCLMVILWLVGYKSVVDGEQEKNASDSSSVEMKSLLMSSPGVTTQ